MVRLRVGLNQLLLLLSSIMIHVKQLSINTEIFNFTTIYEVRRLYGRLLNTP